MGGVSMEWKEVTLGEISSKIGDGLHGTPKYDDEGSYYFINGNNLICGKIVIKDDTKRVGKDEFVKNQKELNEQTILVSINGTIGNVAKYNNELCILGKSACYINVIKEVDKEFIYYVLTSANFKRNITNEATGTTIKNVSLKQMREYKFNIPCNISDQRCIASVLSSLDRKIELNNKINADLEEMAQAIFKNWFVDFEPFKDGKFVDSELGMIPEGWKVGSLDEIFSLKYGKNLSTSMILEKGDYPVYGANGIIGYYNEYNCDKYSVLVTSRGNGSGDVSRTHHSKSFITNNSFVVEPLEQCKYIKLPFINGLFNIIDFKSYCSGSAQPQLTNKAMRSICIISPPKEIVMKYCDILETLFSHIECVIAESSRLSALRDTLLPKLMSGELEVSE